MIRFLRCGLQCLVGMGCFLTLLLFDRSAFQTFREPKFLAFVWIGGACLLVWSLLLFYQAVQKKSVSWPPSPLIALIPIAFIVGIRFWDIQNGITTSSFEVDDIPLKIHYWIHVLLPSVAWLILFSVSSFCFRTSASQRKLLGTLFVALSLEVVIVSLEMVQNQTGLQVNPVSLLSQGEIEVFGQTVKERIFGTIGNPNWVAGYIAVALFPVIAWGLVLRNRWMKSMVFILFLISLFVLVSTRSKGAFLAVTIGFLHFGIIAFIYFRTRIRPQSANVGFSRGIVITVSMLVFLVLSCGFLMANRTVIGEGDSYLAHWAETLALRGDSITVRALLAHCGFEMWSHSPWLGLGPGEFKIQFLDALRDLVEGADGEQIQARVARLHSLRATHLHNEYLQTMVEFGIVGLLFVELFFIWCQCRAFRLILETKNWQTALLRVGFLSGVWAGFGGSLFDYPFHRPAQAFLLAVFLGVSISRPFGYVSGSPSSIRKLDRVTVIPFVVFSFLLSIHLLWQSEAKYVGQHLGFWGRTSLEIAGGDRNKAFEALATAQDMVPGEGEYTLWLAYYYLTAKRDPNLAIRQLRRARETSDNPNRVLLEATAQLERNDIQTAAQLVRFVEILEPHKVGVQFQKAQILQKQGRWEEACRAYLGEIHNAQKSLAKGSPHLEKAYLQLASILEKEIGQYAEAAKYYRKFLELLGDRIPTFPEAQLRLGDLSLNRFHDLDSAESYYREALEIFKKNGSAQEADEVEKILKDIQNRRNQFE